MKLSVTHSGISAIMLFIMMLLSYELILAQDQNPGKNQDNKTIGLPLHELSRGISDPVQPTLNNFGKGLYYYDCILEKQQDKIYSNTSPGDEESIMVKTSLTEMDMENMKYNILFMEEQSQIQLKEWIRKDKWDLNLGEAIKGIYTSPPVF